MLRSWSVRMLLRAPDGHVYVNTKVASDTMGVDHSTVSNWRRRGYLTPAFTHQGRPYYRLQDVARAEKLAREAAQRTSGTTRRVQRRGLLRPQEA